MLRNLGLREVNVHHQHFVDPWPSGSKWICGILTPELNFDNDRACQMFRFTSIFFDYLWR